MGGIAAVAAVMEEGPQDGANILGIHSEGPWLNRVGEKGVRTGWPEVSVEAAKAMVEAGKGHLRLVALAPEIPGIQPVLFDIGNLVNHVGVPLETCLRMACLNPAKKYGFADRKGSIAVGKDADFVVISDDYKAHAVELWRRECPEADLAQHTNFVQYRPVSAPEKVPTLVDGAGLFYRSFRWRGENPDDEKCKGDVYPGYEDLYTETLAQLDRHKELTGRYPRHFEGHSAMTEPMLRAFRDVGEKLHIHNMAATEEEREGIRPARELMSLSNAKAVEILNRGSLPEDFEEDAFGILKSPCEYNILHFHPGYLDQYVLENTSLTLPRCRDLATLCDPRVRAWLEEHEVELADFRALYP